MLGGFGRCIARDPIAARKRTGARRRRSKRFAEPVAVSSTEPPDFPILALAARLVQPFGSASIYSRAALGAVGNLWGRQGSRKWSRRRKFRILRTLNSQHFHSALYNLWITAADVGASGSSDESSIRTRFGRRLGQSPVWGSSMRTTAVTRGWARHGFSSDLT